MLDIPKINAIGNLQDQLLLYSIVCNEYGSTAHSYGLKEVLDLDIRLYPLEIHLLSAINDNPGISARELAEKFYRTKGTISQRIKSLYNYGLITKVTNKENHRVSNLYTTQTGKIACRYHASYDREYFVRYLDVLKEFSEEELATCARIVQCFTETLHQDSAKGTELSERAAKSAKEEHDGRDQ